MPNETTEVKKKRPDRDFFLQKFPDGVRIQCPLPEEVRLKGRPPSYKEWGIFVFKNEVAAGKVKTRECVTLARYRMFNEQEGILHYPRNEAGHFFYDLVSVPLDIVDKVATAMMNAAGKPIVTTGQAQDDQVAATLKRMKAAGVR
jgi:hypothetical protein